MKVTIALGIVASACSASTVNAQARPRFALPQLCNAMSTSALCKLANTGRQPASIPTEFQGGWASSNSGCKNVRQPNDVIEGGGIVVKQASINGYEMGAKVVRIVSSSPGIITFVGRESSEVGDEGTKTITMRVSGLSLSYKSNGIGSGTYVRCSGSQIAAQASKANGASSRSNDTNRVKQLISLYDGNNAECRGTSPDTPANIARVNNACYAREKNAWDLQKLGMCYGTKDQASYQMRWHRCTANSNRAEAPVWVDYG